MVIVKNTFVVILILQNLRAFELKSRYDAEKVNELRARFIMPDEIKEINKLLKTDPGLPKLKETKTLGAGSYGLVVEMRVAQETGEDAQPEKGDAYAVKITNVEEVDEIPDTVSPNDLINKTNQDTMLKTNLQFLEYLGSESVPFILLSAFDLYVLSAVKRGDSDLLIMKNIWVMEKGDKEDMSILSKTRAPQLLEYNVKSDKGSHDDEKSKRMAEETRLALNLLVKLSYAFKEINSRGIIHGDIKPENIFLRSCDVFGEADICPIIGDWDFAYYYDEPINFNERDFNFAPEEGDLGAPHDNIRYTPYYRPVEMCVMQRNEEDFFNNLRMYRYTGKEDVYALGITMLAYLFTINKRFDEDPLGGKLLGIIDGMISPVKATDLLGLFRLEGSIVGIDCMSAVKNISKIKSLIESLKKGMPSELPGDVMTKSSDVDDSQNIYQLFEAYSKAKGNPQEMKKDPNVKEAEKVSEYIQAGRLSMEQVFNKSADLFIEINEGSKAIELIKTHNKEDEVKSGSIGNILNSTWEKYRKSRNENFILNKLNKQRGLIYASDGFLEVKAKHNLSICPSGYRDVNLHDKKESKIIANISLPYKLFSEFCSPANGKTDELLSQSDETIEGERSEEGADLLLDHNAVFSKASSGSNESSLQKHDSKMLNKDGNAYQWDGKRMIPLTSQNGPPIFINHEDSKGIKKNLASLYDAVEHRANPPSTGTMTSHLKTKILI